MVPGKLDFDVFTYENKGGTFDRRPTRRTTLALRIPRIFELLDEFEEVSEQLEAQWDIPARRLDWDGDGEEDYVVDVVGDVLKVFVDCAPPQQRYEDLSVEDGIDGIIEKVVLNDLDRLGDGEESAIDLGELDRFAGTGKGLREATAEPSRWLRDDQGVRARDLDGDAARPDHRGGRPGLQSSSWSAPSAPAAPSPRSDLEGLKARRRPPAWCATLYRRGAPAGRDLGLLREPPSSSTISRPSAGAPRAPCLGRDVTNLHDLRLEGELGRFLAL